MTKFKAKQATKTEASKIRVTKNLLIDKKLKGNKIDILTVSWCRTDPEKWFLKSDEFFDSIRTIPKTLINNTDLVICAGYTVRFERNNNKKIASICDHIKTVPIIYEESNPYDMDEACWKILNSNNNNKIYAIRRSQLITNSNQIKNNAKKLVNVIQNGEGVFQFNNSSYKFLFLICGENNLIKKHTKKSLLPHFINGSIPDIMMNEKWILVNPSHEYYKKGLSTGYRNYDEYIDSKGKFWGGNVLGSIVDRKVFKDGTFPPHTVIHVNNFSNNPNLEYTINNASKVFSQGKGQISQSIRQRKISNNMLVSKYRINLPK